MGGAQYRVFVTARREQGSAQHPGGVMGSGEALGMAGEPAAEVRVRQVVERGGKAPGLPGSTGARVGPAGGPGLAGISLWCCESQGGHWASSVAKQTRAPAPPC